ELGGHEEGIDDQEQEDRGQADEDGHLEGILMTDARRPGASRTPPDSGSYQVVRYPNHHG
ncbi:MAG: hypothetical protein ABGY25_10190, partial [Acidimicrobiales bacterium]